jgi:hypothetical protein
LELRLLQLARPETTVPLAELTQRLLALEQRLGQSAAAGAPPRRTAPAAPQACAPPAEPPTGPEPAGVAPRRRQRAVFAGAVRSSKGEAWTRFLEELDGSAAALAAVLRTSGTLLELDAGRAVVRLQKLRQADRPLVRDARNQKLCCRIFSELLGEPVDVRLEDASELRPGQEDEFTRKVTELFDGRVEE